MSVSSSLHQWGVCPGMTTTSPLVMRLDTPPSIPEPRHQNVPPARLHVRQFRLRQGVVSFTAGSALPIGPAPSDRCGHERLRRGHFERERVSPDDTHARMKILARQRAMSVNKLMEELCAIAVTQHDAETRFRTLSARGSIDEGLRLLDKLDDALGARE